jgi:hypothetical protein
MVRKKLFSFYTENTYLYVCGVTVHGVTIKLRFKDTATIFAPFH